VALLPSPCSSSPRPASKEEGSRTRTTQKALDAYWTGEPPPTEAQTTSTMEASRLAMEVTGRRRAKTPGPKVPAC
jgi:hypothetical protein